MFQVGGLKSRGETNSRDESREVLALGGAGRLGAPPSGLGPWCGERVGPAKASQGQGSDPSQPCPLLSYA